MACNAIFITNGSLASTLSVAIYTGLLVVPVYAIFPLLFRHSQSLQRSSLDTAGSLEALQALAQTGRRLAVIAWMGLALWVAGAVLLVLVYGMQFDLNNETTTASSVVSSTTAVTNSWLYACLITILMDVAFNGTIFITVSFTRAFSDSYFHHRVVVA
jgi:hypothetical protein